jgi:hypothetical protein
VDFQQKLENSFPHFASLIIDQLEEDSVQEICTEEGFLELVKVLRDKYLPYNGRFELVLQGHPKPELPPRLDSPPDIIIELIDYRQVENPAHVTFGECCTPFAHGAVYRRSPA